MRALLGSRLGARLASVDVYMPARPPVSAVGQKTTTLPLPDQELRDFVMREFPPKGVKEQSRYERFVNALISQVGGAEAAGEKCGQVLNEHLLSQNKADRWKAMRFIESTGYRERTLQQADEMIALQDRSDEQLEFDLQIAMKAQLYDEMRQSPDLLFALIDKLGFHVIPKDQPHEHLKAIAETVDCEHSAQENIEVSTDADAR